MRHYNGGQADSGKVLDDYCYITSVLRTLHSKNHFITIKIVNKDNHVYDKSNHLREKL